MMQLHNLDIEYHVLHALITKPGARSTLAPRLNSSNFHGKAPRSAFTRAMSVLAQRGEMPSWATLVSDPAIDEAHRQLLKKFKPKTSLEIRNKKDAVQAVTQLQKYTQLRNLNKLGQFISESLQQSEIEVDAVLDEAAEMMAQARTSNMVDVPLFHIGTGSNSQVLVDKIKSRTKAPLYPTGFAEFDKVNGGLPETGLMIFAAYTSSLKSAMANQIGINMYDINQVNAAKVTLEMSAEQEMRRILSNKTGIPLAKFSQAKLDKKDKKLIDQEFAAWNAHGAENECRLTLYAPTEEVTLTQTLLLLKAYGYKVIIIDYITLLKGSAGGDKQWLDLGNIAREAKIFATAEGVLIIMLAQLSDENKIRYSQTIKEHADGVWQWVVTDEDRQSGQFMVKQVKGRDQELIEFPVEVDFPTLRIGGNGPGRTLSEEDDDVKAYADDLNSEEEAEFH